MTVREGMLPSAMVPGLVTVKEKKTGMTQNLYPVDAKEAINSGDFELVENGAIEAARMAATPLRSGMADNIPKDQIVAEVSGIAGSVVIADSAKEADKVIKSGEHAGAVPAKDTNLAAGGAEKQAEKKAEAAKTDAEKK